MKREILISRKKGEDGHKIVSVRMRDETLARLDDLSAQTNRSRNELINLLLEEALQNVTVIDEDWSIWQGTPRLLIKKGGVRHCRL